MTFLRNSTFLRFLVVGGALALVYSTLAAAATSSLPLPKAVSSALAAVVCVPLGFWCHRRYTFPSVRPHRHALALYAATQAISICITAATSALLARGIFWPDLTVHLFGSGLAAITSFAINRWVVFPDRSTDMTP